MIPVHAKRVFTGVIFDVYQWEQKMFDGSYQTFEALRRPNTVEIIATSPGLTILTLEQEQPDARRPFFSIPGGRIAEGENPLEAAKRELLEETGYASDEWNLYKIYAPTGKIVWTIYVYIARDCRQTQQQRLDSGERISVKSMTIDDFLDRADNDDFRHNSLKPELVRAKYCAEAKKQLCAELFGRND